MTAVTSPAEQACIAFAVVLQRLSRQPTVELQLRLPVGASLSLDLAPEVDERAVLEQLRAQLAPAAAEALALAAVLSLAWQEVADSNAGAALSASWERASDAWPAPLVAQRQLYQAPQAADSLPGLLERALRGLQARATELRPARPLLDLPLLTLAERAHLLGSLAQGVRRPELLQPSTLVEVFAAAVRSHPQARAVEHGQHHLSYSELERRSGRLAALLAGRGLRRGDTAALQLPRGLDLYVAMLAVLRCGAAYLPLDIEWPEQRLHTIVADAQATLLLTTASALALLQVAPRCPSFCLDRPWSAQAGAQPRVPTPPQADDGAYIIYTSGSTGRPKGVPIQHRCVVHLVRAEQDLFKPGSEDRVAQSFSPAFDAAVEEIWLAWAAAATLVVADKADLLADLSATLDRLQISILSTVPTLLATAAGDLPRLRLLIVGGEPCPAALVTRWSQPGRAMFNTYGPTETTVICSYATLTGGAPVTLGRPLANSQIFILDAAGQPLPRGVAGEICIGGAGLAVGYLGQPALTAARFVECLFAGEADAPARLYRSGDLGAYDDRGDLLYLGRLDEQVKVRGNRIELGEVESALLELPGVAQAHAMVREDGTGQAQLVAYLVARSGQSLSLKACRTSLAAQLPLFMQPHRLHVLAALPLLASGKVNRRLLPAPEGSPAAAPAVLSEAPAAPGTQAASTRQEGPLLAQIAACWAAALQLPEVGIDENFFVDLGGHSMLAAQMISQLRRTPALAHLSLLDVYACPTVARLAARAQQLQTVAAPLPVAASPVVRSQAQRRAAILQLLGLYLTGLPAALLWFGPYLLYAVVVEQAGAARATALTFAAYLLLQPALLLLAWLGKWVLVGRLRPGLYPLWGAVHLRLWAAERLLQLAPTWALVGTPWLNRFFRLMGAQIGQQVHLDSDQLRGLDGIQIGDGASVGSDTLLAGIEEEIGGLRVGPIVLDADSTLGARCLVDPGARMDVGSTLTPLSRLRRGDRVPAGATWRGSPAEPDVQTPMPAPRVRRAPPSRRTALWHDLSTLGLCVLLLTIYPLALLPGLLLLWCSEAALGQARILLAPLVALVFVLSILSLVLLLKWLLVGRLAPGQYPVCSRVGRRWWLWCRLQEFSLGLIGSFYATTFLPYWLRALGAKIGRDVEISTVTGFVPELLQVDDGAFVADCVALGTATVALGQLTLAPVAVGARAFIGNSAVVPGGHAVPADALLGCLSIVPSPAALAGQVGGAWFGSPPIILPQRQASTAFAIGTTYRPSSRLRAQRLAMEVLRILLPSTCMVALTLMLLRPLALAQAVLPAAALIALLPLAKALLGLLAGLLVVGLKWALLGRLQPAEQPLWSSFVWANELVTAMHEQLADPLLNAPLLATPYAPWFYRALGARIGRRVFIGTTQFTEYDLISIGDDVLLGNDCTLQTHLFEDRVMKMSTVEVGHGCSVGTDAIVLYDAVLEHGAQLGPMSLLMKGEVLPQLSRWEGIPAQPVRG